MKTFLYPTNNLGKHNNPMFHFYNSYVTQGNNWASYGLHQVELRNDSDATIEVLGWTMKDGRVEEDFKTNTVRPGLFYTARVVPFSWGTHRSVIGAVVFRVQGTSQCFTLAFEDPLHHFNNSQFKGHIEEGNNPQKAIASLKDNSTKELQWGRYEFVEADGRGKSLIRFTNIKK